MNSVATPRYVPLIVPVTVPLTVVSHPPFTDKPLLMITSPSMIVSPVTESTSNTFVPVSQSLEIVNFFDTRSIGTITLNTSPLS